MAKNKSTRKKTAKKKTAKKKTASPIEQPRKKTKCRPSEVFDALWERFPWLWPFQTEGIMCAHCQSVFEIAIKPSAPRKYTLRGQHRGDCSNYAYQTVNDDVTDIIEKGCEDVAGTDDGRR